MIQSTPSYLYMTYSPRTTSRVICAFRRQGLNYQWYLVHLSSPQIPSLSYNSFESFNLFPASLPRALVHTLHISLLNYFNGLLTILHASNLSSSQPLTIWNYPSEKKPNYAITPFNILRWFPSASGQTPHFSVGMFIMES